MINLLYIFSCDRSITTDRAVVGPVTHVTATVLDLYNRRVTWRLASVSVRRVYSDDVVINAPPGSLR